MSNLDKDPNVIWWQSEETVIPYRSPLDGKFHRYFVDFVVKKPNGTFVIEIKPKAQTRPPAKPKNPKTRKYITEVMTWSVNSAKWAAAEEWCADRGYTFCILTEDELGIKF